MGKTILKFLPKFIAFNKDFFLLFYELLLARDVYMLFSKISSEQSTFIPRSIHAFMLLY